MTPLWRARVRRARDRRARVPAGLWPAGLCPTLSQLFRGDLWLQKNRVPALSCGVVCVILRLAVLVEVRRVTDGRTDRRTQGPG